MKNNKKAYELFMQLSPEKRKKLSVDWEIEEIDNMDDQSWMNRFGRWFGSFWNWLWMKHFKTKYKDLDMHEIKLMRRRVLHDK